MPSPTSSSTPLRRRPRRPAPVRLLRRAPRPVRLRRHLRARRTRPPTRTGSGSDVLELVRELGVSHHPLPRRQLRLRLPLGGRRRPARGAPAPARPRLALAPRPTRSGSTSSRGWLDKAGIELMMAVNLGTRGVAGGARPARVRQHRGGHRAGPTCGSRNGATEPYGIRMWCLGNEMDGPWQIGHRTADEYGKLAAQTAQGDAPGRPDARAGRLRQLERVRCPPSATWERDRARAHLRRRRLHLLPRLLRGARRRPRQLPRLGRGHGPLHRRRWSRPPTT